MVVPESPNERPELPSQQGAEAQAVNSLQKDVQGSPVNFNDLNTAFNNDQGDTSGILPGLAFNDNNDSTQKQGDASSISDIASMSMDELETATKMQQAYVAGLESQIQQVTQVAQAAEVQQRVDKLREADEFLSV